MITLSNGRKLTYVVASGSLAFSGLGWFWERPLVWLGLIKPELFTVFIKSLTLHPRKGNLSWWHPWTCVRLLFGDGVVNKVGLSNKGIDWWCKKVGPRLNFKKYKIAGSIFGNEQELVDMAIKLNAFDLVALEVNVSCPNSGHAMDKTQQVIDSVKAVKRVSRHPIIVKVSVDQDYIAIARRLVGVAEAISLNSVPWTTVYPNGERSPLYKLERKVGGGGGGVSGRPAQKHNWKAVQELAADGSLPVIVPSIMDYEDMAHVRKWGAAVSFGAIHLPTKGKPWTVFSNPCKPTQFVKKEMSCTRG